MKNLILRSPFQVDILMFKKILILICLISASVASADVEHNCNFYNTDESENIYLKPNVDDTYGSEISQNSKSGIYTLKIRALRRDPKDKVYFNARLFREGKLLLETGGEENIRGSIPDSDGKMLTIRCSSW